MNFISTGDMEYWIIAILAFIVLGKWIIFIMMSPLLIIFRLLNKRRQDNSKQQHIEPASQPTISQNKSKRHSLLKKSLKHFFRYFMGYRRYMDFQTGLIPSHTIRNFIYRYIFGTHLGKKAIIYWGAEIREHSRLKIGNGSIIGDRAILDARNGIEIGENVNFSSNVHIWTEQHDHRDPYFACNSNSNFKVTIGDRAWIGPDVTILHSVNIGEGAVVAAGSVVTKDIEPFAIVAGIPAKKIADRNQDLRYVFDAPPTPFY